LHPERVNLGPDYPNIPVCVLGTGETSCAPAEVTFRVAFRRLDPDRDYEPASLSPPLPGSASAPRALDMSRFGFFDQLRMGFDPVHRAVLDTCRRLEREGWPLTVVPVDRCGRVDPHDIARALRADTALVSVMAANNEIGTLQPLAEIGALLRDGPALFHVDATQAVGRVALDVDALGIDLLSMSAHKLYGPKGVGALYVRRRPRRVELQPLADGGGQENGLRPGTLNVPGIVGLGVACELALACRDEENARLGRLRERLLGHLRQALDGLSVNGHPEWRLAGNLSIGIEGVEPEALLLGLPELAVSAGAACSSASARPSHVLEAIGATGATTRAALRVGIGRFNTAEEIDRAAQLVVERVRALRAAR
jgi:cysteine desulfurase